jgi:creatinine amidohydrolase
LLLHLSSWPEVEAYLAASQAIIVPIGSTEQHGPNGLVGTDAICAEVIARGVGEAEGAMVAPTINVGIAEHHMMFPGTMTLRPTTLIAVIRDGVDSLARHGFRRFFFINGHGGNVATVRAAFSEIYTEGRRLHGGAAPEVRCVLVNWWETGGVMPLSRELFGTAEGSHATPSEVSVTQAAYPEAIKTAVMEPKVAPTGPIHDSRDYRRRFPDGRIGSDPSLASPEHGQRLIAAAVAGLAAQYRRFAVEA